MYKLYINNENKWPGSLMTSFEPGAMAMFNYPRVEGVKLQFESDDVKLKMLKETEKEYRVTFIMPNKDVYVRTVEVSNVAENTVKKFCPECGTKLILGKPFCPECGFKVN